MPTAISHEKEEVYVGQKGLQQIVVIHNYVDIMCVLSITSLLADWYVLSLSKMNAYL